MVRCKANFPYSIWLIVVECQVNIIAAIFMLRTSLQTGHRVGNRSMSGRLDIHGKWEYNALVGKLSKGPEHQRPNDLEHINAYYEFLQVVLIYVQNACYFFLYKYLFAFRPKGRMCMLLVSHNLHTLLFLRGGEGVIATASRYTNNNMK